MVKNHPVRGIWSGDRKLEPLARWITLGLTLTAVILALVPYSFIKKAIDSQTNLRAYLNFEAYLEGLGDELSLIDLLPRSREGRVLVGLDYVGYGHFSHPSKYKSVYNLMRKHAATLDVICLTDSVQENYLCRDFLPPYLDPPYLHIAALIEKLRRYLEVPLNQEALKDATLYARLEEFVSEGETYIKDNREEAMNLLVKAIMTTEAAIQKTLDEAGADLAYVDNLPVHIIVIQDSKVGFLGIHETRKKDRRDKKGRREMNCLRVKNDNDAVQLLVNAWTEYHRKGWRRFGPILRGYKVNAEVYGPTWETDSIGAYRVKFTFGNGAVRRIERPCHGTISEVWLEDLGGGCVMELIVWTTSADTHRYGSIDVFHQRDSQFEVREVKEIDKELLENLGYIGHDTFEVVGGQLIRSFPIYKESDIGCQPNGKRKRFKYDPSENCWREMEDCTPVRI